MSKRTKYMVINILILLMVFGISKYIMNHHPANNSVPTITSSNNAASPSPEQPAQCHMNGELPDATCTPGAINPDVSQDNIKQTICISGYTKTIRPSVGYTDNLKAQQMQQYGFTDSTRLHEEDHLISLELGGSPADPKNLWPEPHASPNPKDKVENFLHAAVCDGRVSLQEAQKRIMTDWTTAEQGL